MKTLIINGSPRKDGDTQALLGELVRRLNGDKMVLSHESRISPCVDCRRCWKLPGCPIDDDMHGVYGYLGECDNVVLASPIWYSSLSGVALNISSRFQTLYAARRFRGEGGVVKPKNGVLLIVGAEAHTKDAPIATALAIMKTMGVKRPVEAVITSLDTDKVPAKDDKTAMEHARKAADRLNSLCDGL